MHVNDKNSVFKHLDFIILDLLCMFLSFIFANLIYFGRLNYYSNNIFANTCLFILVPLLFIDVVNNQFSGVLRRNNVDELIIVVKNTIYNFIVTILLMYVIKFSGTYSRVVIVLTYLLFIVFAFVIRTIWKKMIIQGKIVFLSNVSRSLLIISKYEDIKQVLSNINNEEYKQYEIKGLCIVDKDLCGKKIDGYEVICNKKDIYNTVLNNEINEIYVASKNNIITPQLAQKLINSGIGIHININDIYNIEPDTEYISNVGIYRTLELGLFEFTPKQVLYILVKRLIDIIVSIIMTIPLLLLSLIIKITYLLNKDNNSIFYKQDRVGKDGNIFEIYKFRTMDIDAEDKLVELLKNKENKKEWIEYHKLKNDPRTTKIGNLLRRTSLDEFPQFINVLKGDMSIIGPRPLVEGELEYHKGLKLYERVKPGITGWWACNGRSNISYDERLELEYFYVKNISFSLDLLIVLRTIVCIFKKTGAQ